VFIIQYIYISVLPLLWERLSKLSANHRGKLGFNKLIYTFIYILFIYIIFILYLCYIYLYYIFIYISFVLYLFSGIIFIFIYTIYLFIFYLYLFIFYLYILYLFILHLYYIYIYFICMYLFVYLEICKHILFHMDQKSTPKAAVVFLVWSRGNFPPVSPERQKRRNKGIEIIARPINNNDYIIYIIIYTCWRCDVSVSLNAWEKSSINN